MEEQEKVLELQKPQPLKRPLPKHKMLSLPQTGACEGKLLHAQNQQDTIRVGEATKEKKQKKKKQKQQKQKEREEEINIIRTRANQSTFINTEGK